MADNHLFIVVLTISFIFASSASSDRKVTIKQGILNGKEYETRSGRKVSGFLGIPYAAPPVGDLRFKSPQPPLSWEGERDATKEGSICLQQNILTEKGRNSMMGDEDCLFLNVFTPKMSKDANLAVMFFIHGGGYAVGSGSAVDYGPELLLDRDVVLVTTNYRLGPLGFLSTGDSALPGNMGLKDQQAALRWVQNNIAHFGGDANSVTIFGESAGGGSVHLQMLSPSSKGLFHAAISQSGTALSPWAFSFPDRHRKMAAKLADLVGCPSQPSQQFIKCLMNLPAEQIVSAQQHFIEWDMDPVVQFNPALEPEGVDDAFLTQDPWTLTSDIPWMVGFNENEGGIKVSSLTQGNVARKFKELNEDPEYIFPMFLYYEHTAQNPKQVTKAIRDFYFGGENVITSEDVPKILQLHTDSYFMAPALEAARRHSGPVFVYYFAYNMSNSFSLCSHYYDNPQYFGVCHFDELLYIFPMEGYFPRLVEGNQDYIISKYMVELWTNYAQKKVPKLESTDFWKTREGCAKKYLHISKEGIELKTNLLAERDQFWRDLPFRDNVSTKLSSHKISDEL